MERLPLVTLAVGTALGLALGVTGTVAYDASRGDGDETPDSGAAAAPSSGAPTSQAPAERPTSVILLIGDGMDDSMITAARNYSVGAAGRLVLDGLPATGAMTTYGLVPGPGPDFTVDYVSDSAATASGFSTGVKTIDGRISQGPSAAAEAPGEDHETVLETYARSGRLTGNVTTADITDATPAAAAAHVNDRSCQDSTTMAACPAALKSAGGRGSIAEQLLDTGVDVLLGGGQERFDRPLEDGSASLLEHATTDRGYRSVRTADELADVDALDGGRLLGLFAPVHLTRKYAPLEARRGGATTDDGRCVEQDRGTQPTLAQMTTTAIDVLDNADGFFLQVEGASVDKAEHERDICGAIGELEDLDLAVQVALEHQSTHPGTLVIVTGDHAHSTQIVMDDRGGIDTATVTTADGDPMTVAYSTTYREAGDSKATHTGTQIRVAAIGPGSERVTGVIDQTELHAIMLGG
ncbi:alkaline phosphatase [Nocardioides glacieisoli]|uniref:Alkaline phosphatase n=1 Tax=Nocardioides glacieisoli TaxID=1168730 RepID=A0A4Q2RUA2_9ACTN|nr:alkaline phosphatase [Nocardioides glacieisoli]RYB91435.1 alkaline phosphatase [Nocardioides glacieisoli]